ncbi:MAG: hypothetical protein AAF968_12565 [Pseudomonadota bacterium]
MRRALRRRQPGERGFVLVAVLWLGVALAIAASGFLAESRRDSYRLRAELGRAAAVEIARTGLNLALAELGRPASAARVPRDGTSVSIAVPGGMARIGIRDEKGKVDLNKALAPFLAGTLAQLSGRGLDALDHALLADQLLKAARDAREAGTAPSLAELLASAGLSNVAAARASQLLTLHSYTARVNAAHAPREVLASIPVLNPEEVEAILEARSLGETLPIPTRAQGWFVPSEGPVYTIHVTGRTDAGITAAMTAMVLSEGRTIRTGLGRFSVLEARILP